jgi:hypothetical protein
MKFSLAERIKNLPLRYSLCCLPVKYFTVKPYSFPVNVSYKAAMTYFFATDCTDKTKWQYLCISAQSVELVMQNLGYAIPLVSVTQISCNFNLPTNLMTF